MATTGAVYFLYCGKYILLPYFNRIVDNDNTTYVIALPLLQSLKDKNKLLISDWLCIEIYLVSLVGCLVQISTLLRMSTNS